MNSRRIKLTGFVICFISAFALSACDTQQDFGAIPPNDTLKTSSSDSISGGTGAASRDGDLTPADDPTIDTNPCAANIDPLLGLADGTLFKLALENKLGQCRIQDGRNEPTVFCDYYVHSAVIGSVGHDGYPKNPYSGDSTGCVVAPSLPKHVTFCWYGYTPSTMCTDNYVKNAANQLRQAIMDGACGCAF